jgi:hypothetical protein
MIYEEVKGLEITKGPDTRSEYQRLAESIDAPLLVEDQYQQQASELYDYLVGLGVDEDEASELFSLLGSFGLEDGVDTFMDDYGDYYPILRRKEDQIRAMAVDAGYIPIR